MNKSLVILLLYSLAVQLPNISLTLLKSRLSGVTEVNLSNMLNLRWIWSYKWYAVGIMLIAVPWVINTFMTAQLAKEFSQGTQTAVVSTLAGAVIASVFGFLRFFEY